MAKNQRESLTNSAMEAINDWQRLSMDFWRNAFTTGRQLGEEWMRIWPAIDVATPGRGKRRSVPCCPPVQECPPHCLAAIRREANTGEVIRVSFALCHNCGGTKTYRVGVRPLRDQDGNEAPSQPQLDKQQVTLDPGQSVQVHMRVDLSQGFQPGSVYKTEIVVREKEVNQNICFELRVKTPVHVPEVCLRPEAEYLNRFQSWESHFYCEKPRSARITPTSAQTKKEDQE